MDNHLKGAYSAIDSGSPDLSLRLPPDPPSQKRAVDDTRMALSDDATSKSSASRYSRNSNQNIFLRCLNLDYSWVVEVLAVVISAAALATMAGILYHFDGAQPPQWRHVSLNTFVAGTSTIARASIGLIVSNALGQLKWIWFASRTRKLVDISTFESASRGALGSAQLMWMQRSSHFATLGCVLLILLLGFDPFTQSLVNYPQRQVADPNQLAVLANGSLYDATGPMIAQSQSMAGEVSPPTYFVDPVLRANVYSALFDVNPDQTWATPQYNCRSGNCTWHATMTLTAEYSCQNITHLIKNHTVGYNQTFGVPNGVSLGYYDLGGYAMDESIVYFNMSTSDHTVDFSDTLGNIDPLLQVQYIVSPTNYYSENMSTLTAMECVLYPCVRKISGSVNNNEYTEIYEEFVNGSTTENVTSWCETSTPQYGTALYYENVGTSLNPPTEAGSPRMRPFGFSQPAEASLKSFLESLFNGYIATLTVGDQDESSSTTSFGTSSPDYNPKDVLQSVYYGPLPGCDTGKDQFECAMNNIAKGLTKTFRDSAFIKNETQGANMTVGDTLVERTFVRINWYWFIGPAVIWLAAVILWLGTTIKTSIHKIPVWRSNPLPLLFLYRENKAEEDGDGYITSNEAYTKRASEIRVRLHAGREHADLS